MDELITNQTKGRQKKLRAVAGETLKLFTKREGVSIGDYGLPPDVIFRGQAD